MKSTFQIERELLVKNIQDLTNRDPLEVNFLTSKLDELDASEEGKRFHSAPRLRSRLTVVNKKIMSLHVNDDDNPNRHIGEDVPVSLSFSKDCRRLAVGVFSTANRNRVLVYDLATTTTTNSSTTTNNNNNKEEKKPSKMKSKPVAFYCHEETRNPTHALPRVAFRNRDLNDKVIMSLGHDGTLCLHDATTGVLIGGNRIEAEDESVANCTGQGIALPPGVSFLSSFTWLPPSTPSSSTPQQQPQNLIAVTTSDETVRIVDVDNKRLVGPPIAPHQEFINDVVCVKNALVTCSADGTSMLYRLVDSNSNINSDAESNNSSPYSSKGNSPNTSGPPLLPRSPASKIFASSPLMKDIERKRQLQQQQQVSAAAASSNKKNINNTSSSSKGSSFDVPFPTVSQQPTVAIVATKVATLGPTREELMRQLQVDASRASSASPQQQQPQIVPCISCVAISKDASCIATGDEVGNVRLFDGQNGRIVGTISMRKYHQSNSNNPSTMNSSSNSSRSSSSGADEDEDDDETSRRKEKASSSSTNSSSKRKFELLQQQKFQEAQMIQHAQIDCMAFAGRDSRTLIVGCRAGFVRFIDVERGEDSCNPIFFDGDDEVISITTCSSSASSDDERFFAVSLLSGKVEVFCFDIWRTALRPVFLTREFSKTSIKNAFQTFKILFTVSRFLA